MTSTIDYYYQRRRALYKAVLQANDRPTDKITCANCGKDKNDAKCLDIDHVNTEDGHTDLDGGWQHLYKLEQDLADDIELQILCRECHKAKHDKPIFTVTLR